MFRDIVFKKFNWYKNEKSTKMCESLFNNVRYWSQSTKVGTEQRQGLTGPVLS